MKRILPYLIALFLLPFSVQTENVNPVALRALLIGGDTFFSQENTYPIAETNLTRMANALATDCRVYQSIQIYYDEIGHEAALRKAVDTAFFEADKNDISLLYFSTHGSIEENKAGLYLCNGTEESLLSAQTLSDILRQIPGQKMLILDACNSGAFIGKGMDSLSPAHPFTGTDTFVITSAGGCEASWQWQSQDAASLSGSSYFTDVLVKGLTDAHAADQNRDGSITLNEAFSFLTTNYAASTPQRYPLDSGDFSLYEYVPSQSASSAALTDITFEDTLLTAGRSDLHFSFTVHRPVALYYQLVYYQNGAWDFENAQMFRDLEGKDALLSPGRKQRSLHLDAHSNSDSGYAMIQFFSMEGEQPVFQGARLLCVQPDRGPLQLSVQTSPHFFPDQGEELSILVYHDMPCALSVSLRNKAGKTVRRLSYAQPSRPQQLPLSASTFYWDGKDQQGHPVRPDEEYTVFVQVTLGEERFTAESAPFFLASTQKKEGIE